MPTPTSHGAMFAIVDAKRGTNGTDSVLSAKFAKYNPKLQYVLDHWDYLPEDVVDVGSEATFSIFTNDAGEYVAHTLRQDFEKVIIGYEAGSKGIREIEFVKCKRAGAAEVQIPAREGSGQRSIPGYELMFQVIKPSLGKTLADAVIVRARP